jgi:hypothetical protein
MPSFHSLDTLTGFNMVQNGIVNGVNGHIKTTNGVQKFSTIEESVEAIGKSMDLRLSIYMLKA